MQTASPDVPHVCDSRAPCTTAAGAEGRRRRPPPRRPGHSVAPGLSCLVVVVALNTS